MNEYLCGEQLKGAKTALSLSGRVEAVSSARHVLILVFDNNTQKNMGEDYVQLSSHGGYLLIDAH